MTRLEEVRSLIDLALTAKASGVPCARLDAALQFAQERLGDALVASASALDIASAEPEPAPLPLPASLPLPAPEPVDAAALRPGDRVLVAMQVSARSDADGDVRAAMRGGYIVYCGSDDEVLRDPRPQPTS